MSGKRVPRVNHEWIRLRDALGPRINRLNWVAFMALASGRPPTIADLASQLGLPEAAVKDICHEAVQRGLLTMEDHRITGSRGLSVTPTRYKLRLGEPQMYTWCALDAVGIPAALGQDAHIEATLLDGTAAVAIDISKGPVTRSDPADLRIGLPSPNLEKSVRETLCPRIGFHLANRTPEHPDISILSLDEAADLGRKVWAEPEHLSR